MTTGHPDPKLKSALRALADETSAAGASPHIQSALLAELRARRRTSPAVAWRWWGLAGCAAAAGLLLFLAPARRPQAPVSPAPPPVADYRPPETPAEPVAVPERPRPVAQRASLRERAITPWYYNQALPPARSGQVLRVKVTPEVAASFGALSIAAPGGTVTADLLIGEDGMARAIRFVQ